MAPLGILTAIVSIIRLRGGPSLRAFIGRAQEGMGEIEAELCSSTSRDICEMYNNGGISRVYGQPKLLEVVYNCSAKSNEFFDSTTNAANAGVDTFQSYYEKIQDDRTDADWKEIRTDNKKQSRALFAPNPNLSLNIWMKRPHFIVTYVSALVGFVLQFGVIAIAVIITYHLRLAKGGSEPPPYACPAMIAGTVFLCTGIFLCAFMIGEYTEERWFRRASAMNGNDGMKPKTKMVWIQLGGQLVGDQTFDAFAYSDYEAKEPMREYITSLKKPNLKDGGLAVWLAILLSALGFVLQFIGLRGLHSAVALSQLGATLLMSIIRALLRTQRLSAADNLLERTRYLVQGYELEWLALYLGTQAVDDEKSKRRPRRGVGELSFNPLQLGSQNSWLYFKGFGIGKRLLDSVDTDGKQGPPDQSGAAKKTWILGSTKKSASFSDGTVAEETYLLTDVQRVFAIRRRLARLTGQGEASSTPIQSSEPFPDSLKSWPSEAVFVRDQARHLANAIQDTAGILFASDSDFEDDWKEAIHFWWANHCYIATLQPKEQYSSWKESTISAPTHLKIRRESNTSNWKIDTAELEAMLGLWLWSLIHDPRTDGMDESTQAIKSYAETIKKEKIVLSTLSEGAAPPPDNTLLLLGGYDFSFEKSQLLMEQKDLTRAERAQNAEQESSENGDWRWKPDEINSLTSNIWIEPFKRRNHGHRQFMRMPPPSGLTDGHYRHDDRKVRFFGWNLTPLRFEESTSPDAQWLWITSTPTESPLLHLCTQEIYASFINAAFAVIEKIGGETNVEAVNDGFRLQNTILTSIFSTFSNNHLGTGKDAVLTVVPAIGSRLTVLEGLINSSRRQANELRRQHKWRDAEELLRWTWQQCVPKTGISFHEKTYARQAAVLLGELYRWAMASKTSKYAIEFGLEGVAWMCSEASSGDLLQDIRAEVANTAALYAAVGYHKRKQDPEFGTKAAAFQSYGMSSLRATDCLTAVRQRFLLETLVLADNAPAASLSDLLSLVARIDEEVEQGAWVVIAGILLDLGSNPNLPDSDGRSPLSRAAEAGGTMMVKMLLEAGAVPNCEDSIQRTPLHYAAARGHLDILQILLQNSGVEPDCEDNESHTPAWLAADNEHYEVLQKLAATGRVRLESALLQAATKGNERMVRLLLNATGGCDHNLLLNANEAYLHAAGAGLQTLVQVLLATPSVDPKYVDVGGNTALHFAVQNGHDSMVRFLLGTVHLDPHKADKAGRKPMHIATEKGYESIALLLQGSRTSADAFFQTGAGV